MNDEPVQLLAGFSTLHFATPHADMVICLAESPRVLVSAALFLFSPARISRVCGSALLIHHTTLPAVHYATVMYSTYPQIK